MDQEVFRLACRLHHTWAGTPLGGLRLALNVSRRTLERPGFCRWAQATAKREGACPAALELEVTESAPPMRRIGDVCELEFDPGHLIALQG